jgi:hypothetical protein
VGYPWVLGNSGSLVSIFSTFFIIFTNVILYYNHVIVCLWNTWIYLDTVCNVLCQITCMPFMYLYKYYYYYFFLSSNRIVACSRHDLSNKCLPGVKQQSPAHHCLYMLYSSITCATSGAKQLILPEYASSPRIFRGSCCGLWLLHWYLSTLLILW